MFLSSYAGAQAGRGHKPGSTHGGGHRSSNGRHSKSGKQHKSSSSGTGAAPQVIPHSFLFVVNELQVDFEPRPGDAPPTDQWLNTVPPQSAEAYTGETPGTVFRYQNGVVSPAPGYVWHRPGMGHPGGIARIDQAGRIDGWPGHYKTQTVFACSPLLPIIVADTDASLGYAAMQPTCGCGRAPDERCARWRPLHFDRLDGRSRVNSYACGATFAAGRDASWIPALVPRAYQNTGAGAVASAGLAGELPIIIALMAFHGRPGRASEVFFEQRWHLCRWRGSSASPYLPKAGDDPRGFVVQVCYDNLVPGQEDTGGSDTEEEYRAVLEYLEYATVLVQDVPRSRD